MALKDTRNFRRLNPRDATSQKSTLHTSPATFGENSAYFCITPSLFASPFTPSRGCDAALLYDKAAPVAAQRCGTQRENDAPPFHPLLSTGASSFLSLFAVIKNRRVPKTSRGEETIGGKKKTVVGEFL